MTVPVISETVIDAVAESLETASPEKALSDFGHSQPVVVSYLMSDSFQILHEEEQEYMLYLALVIWRSVEEASPGRPAVSEKVLGNREEINWGLIEESKSKRFHDQLDAFFADTTQEDLLAFVEDALTIDPEEEDHSVTKEGRIPMVVALKTIIDVLCEPENEG